MLLSAKSSSDTWVIIHNNIYDVSEYINHHPGGRRVIERYLGKDATQPFQNLGHGKTAYEMLEKIKIGSVDD